jgi:hypothetical protein
VSRQYWAAGSHSCSQASWQTSVQALQYEIGTVSAEEPEGDAVLPVRRPEMVWVALVRLVACLRVFAQVASQAVSLVVFQAGVDVVLVLQA